MAEIEIVVDCATGEQRDVVMSPESEAAFGRMRAHAQRQQAERMAASATIQPVLEKLQADAALSASETRALLRYLVGRSGG